MTVARKLISFESTRFCQVTSLCRPSSKYCVWRAANGFQNSPQKLLRPGQSTSRLAFLCLPRDCRIWLTDLPNIPARTFAWNPRGNIGFPYSIFLKRLAVSCWPTPSTQSLRRATKPTTRMPGGSATCILRYGQAQLYPFSGYSPVA